MKIAKKPKKSRTDGPTIRERLVTEFTTYLALAVMARTLIMVDNFTEEKWQDVLDSFSVLMEEVADGRTTVMEFLRDTKELTGFDVSESFEPSELYKRVTKEADKWLKKVGGNN